MLNRRGILLGIGSALAMPAIVHAGNLMPIKPERNIFKDEYVVWRFEGDIGFYLTRKSVYKSNIFKIMRRNKMPSSRVEINDNPFGRQKGHTEFVWFNPYYNRKETFIDYHS